MLEKRSVKFPTESSGADTGPKFILVPVYDTGTRGGSWNINEFVQYQAAKT